VRVGREEIAASGREFVEACPDERDAEPRRDDRSSPPAVAVQGRRLGWLSAAPTAAALSASATDQLSQLLAAVYLQPGAGELRRLTAAGS
jgi:hypothetical protein